MTKMARRKTITLANYFKDLSSVVTCYRRDGNDLTAFSGLNTRSTRIVLRVERAAESRCKEFIIKSRIADYTIMKSIKFQESRR